MVNVNTPAETIPTFDTSSWTKEDHIKYLHDRVAARQRRMSEMVESMKRMHVMNDRDLLRIEELRLLRDVRDGKITLVHTASGQPFNVRVFKPSDING